MLYFNVRRYRVSSRRRTSCWHHVQKQMLYQLLLLLLLLPMLVGAGDRKLHKKCRLSSNKLYINSYYKSTIILHVTGIFATSFSVQFQKWLLNTHLDWSDAGAWSVYSRLVQASLDEILSSLFAISFFSLYIYIYFVQQSQKATPLGWMQSDHLLWYFS